MEEAPGETENNTYPTTYEEALAHESAAARVIAQNMANVEKEQTAETLAVIENIDTFVPRGLYEHFKSTPEHPMHYRVTGIIDDVNSGLCCVKYVAEYGAYKGRERQRVLAGPNSWLRPIDRPEYKGPRFIQRSVDAHIATGEEFIIED
jgi:hypothetical protein